MRMIGFAAILALLASGSASGQTPTPTDKKDGQKVVCKSTAVMGSRIGSRKTCKTAQEWQDLRQQTRETIEKSQQLWQKNG